MCFQQLTLRDQQAAEAAEQQQKRRRLALQWTGKDAELGREIDPKMELILWAIPEEGHMVQLRWVSQRLCVVTSER